MPFAFLPYRGQIWLCHVDGPHVSPLAQAPGGPEAIRRFSTDGAEFGFLDQQGKRLGHYRLLDTAPWFECVATPTALSKSCRAYDFVIHKGTLIAGGYGREYEALWVRNPAADSPWRSIPLPEGIGKRGKAIDALFVRGKQLVAIDNVMLPKWILVYQLEPELTSNGVEKFGLARHTTYERTKMAVEGPHHYAVLSSGVNHERVSHHLALIDKGSLLKVFGWSGIKAKTTEELIHEAGSELLFSDDESLLLNGITYLDEFSATLKLFQRQFEKSSWRTGAVLEAIKDMAFCGNRLILALGNQEIQVANVTSKISSKASLKKRAPLASFRSYPLTKVKCAIKLQCAGVEPTGFFVIGTDEAGQLDFEWVAFSNLGV